MIAFHRTASIAPGKTASAISFARDIAAYMKEAYSVHLDVQLPVGGNPQRIAWSTEYKDLASFEAVQTKLLTDKHYWDVVNRGADNFLAASINDNLWRSI
jgi:hypothetical protein